MTLEQFFATHRAPNAIVVPQTRAEKEGIAAARKARGERSMPPADGGSKH